MPLAMGMALLVSLSGITLQQEALGSTQRHEQSARHISGSARTAASRVKEERGSNRTSRTIIPCEISTQENIALWQSLLRAGCFTFRTTPLSLALPSRKDSVPLFSQLLPFQDDFLIPNEVFSAVVIQVIWNLNYRRISH